MHYIKTSSFNLLLCTTQTPDTFKNSVHIIKMKEMQCNAKSRTQCCWQAKLLSFIQFSQQQQDIIRMMLKTNWIKCINLLNVSNLIHITSINVLKIFQPYFKNFNTVESYQRKSNFMLRINALHVRINPQFLYVTKKNIWCSDNLRNT